MTVSAEDVRTVLGNKSRTPDDSVLDGFISEAEGMVAGRLGTSEGIEAQGIVRDLAASRVLFMMRAGQSSETPRIAEVLYNDAMTRLKDLEQRTAGSVADVDEEAFYSPGEVGLTNFLYGAGEGRASA